jgi:hypothetical protein
MTTTVSRILTAEVTTTASATSYTAPANTQVQFRACTLVNKTGTARWVTAIITPSGGTARNVLYRKVISAGQSYPAPQVVAQALNAGDKIEFEAEANSAIDLVLSASLTS